MAAVEKDRVLTAVVLWPLQRQLLAGSSRRKPPPESPLRDTLLTLIAPDLMGTTAAKGHTLGAEHELPRRTVIGMKSGWRQPIGTNGGFGSESMAEFIGLLTSTLATGA